MGLSLKSLRLTLLSFVLFPFALSATELERVSDNSQFGGYVQSYLRYDEFFMQVGGASEARLQTSSASPNGKVVVRFASPLSSFISEAFGSPNSDVGFALARGEQGSTRILVGAPGMNNGNGMVYAFDSFLDITSANDPFNQPFSGVQQISPPNPGGNRFGEQIVFWVETNAAGTVVSKHFAASSPNADRVELYRMLGSATTWSHHYTISYPGLSPSGGAVARYGDSMTLMDMNGDGKVNDLVVGAPRGRRSLSDPSNAGAVYVYANPASASSALAPVATFSGTEAGQDFGDSVDFGAGDILAIGAPRTTRTFQGRNASGNPITIVLNDSGGAFVFKRIGSSFSPLYPNPPLPNGDPIGGYPANGKGGVNVHVHLVDGSANPPVVDVGIGSLNDGVANSGSLQYYRVQTPHTQEQNALVHYQKPGGVTLPQVGRLLKSGPDFDSDGTPDLINSASALTNGGWAPANLSLQLTTKAIQPNSPQQPSVTFQAPGCIDSSHVGSGQNWLPPVMNPITIGGNAVPDIGGPYEVQIISNTDPNLPVGNHYVYDRMVNNQELFMISVWYGNPLPTPVNFPGLIDCGGFPSDFTWAFFQREIDLNLDFTNPSQLNFIMPITNAVPNLQGAVYIGKAMIWRKDRTTGNIIEILAFTNGNWVRLG